jgi:Mn-dependent DtxR family transcriptional regulator
VAVSAKGFQHPRLNDAAWLAQAYETRSTDEVADSIGVSATSVQRALIAHGIPRRSCAPLIADPQLADRDWLEAAYANSTILDVASRLGVAPATVSRALEVHGIDRHPPLPRTHIRSELDDADWLRAQYATRPMSMIAADLGVAEATVQTAMVRLRIERRTREESNTLSRPDLLDTPDQLAEALETAKVFEIAAELGVAVPTIHKALKRQGIQSPRRYHGWVRHQRPSTTELQEAWDAEETIKGVARHFGVSVNTSAVWLAQIGVFISDTPVISRDELLKAIERGDSLDTIRRTHSVTGRTVVVELYRHHLFDAHKRRHMQQATP